MTLVAERRKVTWLGRMCKGKQEMSNRNVATQVTWLGGMCGDEEAEQPGGLGFSLSQTWKRICIIYVYVHLYVSVYDRPDRARLGDIGGDLKTP